MYKCCICRHRIIFMLILCFRNISEYTGFSQAQFSIIAHQAVILKKYGGGGGEAIANLIVVILLNYL